MISTRAGMREKSLHRSDGGAVVQHRSHPTQQKMPKLIVVEAFDRDDAGELRPAFAPRCSANTRQSDSPK